MAVRRVLFYIQTLVLVLFLALRKPRLLRYCHELLVRTKTLVWTKTLVRTKTLVLGLWGFQL